MIELHLIGYTEDREHLVLDLEVDGDGRYTVRIDPDLLATVEQLRSDRVARGAPVDLRDGPAGSVASVEAEDAPSHSTDDTDPHGQPPVVPPPLPPRRRRGGADRGVGPQDVPRVATPARVPASPPRRAVARAGERGAPPRVDEAADPPPEVPEPPPEVPEPRDEAVAAAPVDDVDEVAPAEVAAPASGFRPAAQAVRHARLTPAEIQQRLRAGRSPRTVAKEAGTDLAWIERWLAPIEAERERVLADARARRLDVPRARPLGVAVDRALADRNVAADRVTWTVARRDDGRWRVTVRFEERSRPRSATWLLDPEEGRLQAASPLATELASPAPARRRS